MKFFVDEEKKVVVCKMGETSEDGEFEGPVDEAMKYILGGAKKLYKSMFDRLSISWMFESGIEEIIRPIVGKHVKKEYVGKAKCSPNDEFNEAYGRELAKSRCLVRYWTDVAAAAEEVTQLAYDFYLELADRHTNAVRHALDREKKVYAQLE